MTCGECGYEQTQGRFCGRCGVRLLSSRDPEATEPDGPLTLLSSARAGTVAAVAVLIVAVGWLTYDARQPSVPDAGGADPPSPTAASPSVTPAPTLTSPVTEGAPVDFGEPTGVTLLFDDGLQGVLAVDLDTGRQRRVELPMQRAGDQPFRLWPMGGRVIVGWDQVWAVDLTGVHASRKLGDARLFVPHAEPEQLWLIDATRPGTKMPTWTLIDAGGQVLAEVAPPRQQLQAIRGVPGGLAVRGTGGDLLVYDLDEGELRPLADGPASLADATRTRVSWCRDPCQRLQVHDENGAQVAMLEAARATRSSTTACG